MKACYIKVYGWVVNISSDLSVTLSYSPQLQPFISYMYVFVSLCFANKNNKIYHHFIVKHFYHICKYLFNYALQIELQKIYHHLIIKHTAGSERPPQHNAKHTRGSSFSMAYDRLPSPDLNLGPIENKFCSHQVHENKFNDTYFGPFNPS